MCCKLRDYHSEILCKPMEWRTEPSYAPAEKTNIAGDRERGIQRRRINKVQKVKVVSAVRGPELLRIIAALAILHQTDKKKLMNSSCSSYRPGAIHSIFQIVRVQNS